MELYKMNVWQIVLAGGPMMWPILLCSVFALALVMERLWYLRTIAAASRGFVNQILNRIKRQQVKEAIEACDQAGHPVAQVLKAGLLAYDRPRSQIKEAIEDASLYEVPKLEKNLAVLATIAHIAPLLGFLGTVIGMVRCFQVIQARASVFNPVSVSDLASGIWEALLSTVAGLAVAIVTFVVYNYLVSWVQQMILEMEKAATQLINCLTE